ncbi:MAG: hypothetical protein RL186_707 [Pseudomonadota bacterium]
MVPTHQANAQSASPSGQSVRPVEGLRPVAPQPAAPPSAAQMQPQPRSPSAALAHLQAISESTNRTAQTIIPKAVLPQTNAAPAANAPAAPWRQTDRRRASQPHDRIIGRVVYCSGSRATISTELSTILNATGIAWSVGQMISIDVGVNRVVALVYEIRTEVANWDDAKASSVNIEVELMGEVFVDDKGMDGFRSGVSRYPNVGSVAHEIRHSDLEVMHKLQDRKAAIIGQLSQNEDVSATISVDDVLQKHFALLGTTGVGKSCAATLLMRQCLAARPDLRIVLLDPHNEFGRTFESTALLLDSNSLELPYWLFRYDEFEDVVFRARVNAVESDILQDLIALAKAQYHAEKSGLIAQGTLRKSTDAGIFNADTPTPYRMADLFKLIDDILGHLEPRYDRSRLKALRVRLDGLVNDQRYAFMFPKGAIGDNFAAILANLFRLQGDGKQMSIVNLSGLPSDVTNAVVSVMARLSFDVAYASEGALHVMLVCEEAHRYIPQDAGAGFLPTRRAISRIAKEGRKYGCSIGVVSQRPCELDSTILSQCSTVFAMRLSNERDQNIMRSAISDSGASTIAFLSALDNREAIVFGEGVSMPMRFKFTNQKSEQLPSAPGTTVDSRAAKSNAKPVVPNAHNLVSRLRGLTDGGRSDPNAMPKVG